MIKKKCRELYKRCRRCLGHSYLTLGDFYLCVNCGYKEYKDNEEESREVNKTL